MKLVIAGKNSIAVDVLKHVIEQIDIQVFVILNSTENFVNGFQESLGFYAKLWGIPIIELADVYPMDNTIFLSLEFDKIIKPKLFKSRQLFNIHFSKLPEYKGMYTSALPILNGESETGVTLHYIDEGIDTGDIIYQETFKLDKNETARSLYFKYIQKGTELVINSLQDIINNNYCSYRQTMCKSTYFGKDSINYSNLKFNLKQTAYQIDRQLRAFTFREYQLPLINDHEIGKWKILEKKSTRKPGDISFLDDSTMLLSTIDYEMELYLDQYPLLWNYCINNNLPLLKQIYQKENFDLELKTKEGWTALILAVYNNAYDCVKFLIENGADVNAFNYNKTTVLMYAKSSAIKSRDFSTIKLLINAGANIKAKDVYNKTVLNWAKEEDIEIYNLLRKAND